MTDFVKSGAQSEFSINGDGKCARIPGGLGLKDDPVFILQMIFVSLLAYRF